MIKQISRAFLFACCLLSVAPGVGVAEEPGACPPAHCLCIYQCILGGIVVSGAYIPADGPQTLGDDCKNIPRNLEEVALGRCQERYGVDVKVKVLCKRSIPPNPNSGEDEDYEDNKCHQKGYCACLWTCTKYGKVVGYSGFTSGKERTDCSAIRNIINPCPKGTKGTLACGISNEPPPGLNTNATALD